MAVGSRGRDARLLESVGFQLLPVSGMKFGSGSMRLLQPDAQLADTDRGAHGSWDLRTHADSAQAGEVAKLGVRHGLMGEAPQRHERRLGSPVVALAAEALSADRQQFGCAQPAAIHARQHVEGAPPRQRQDVRHRDRQGRDDLRQKS